VPAPWPGVGAVFRGRAHTTRRCVRTPTLAAS
jgi:hypothetical protein